jgi:hypothetical protein
MIDDMGNFRTTLGVAALSTPERRREGDMVLLGAHGLEGLNGASESARFTAGEGGRAAELAKAS